MADDEFNSIVVRVPYDVPCGVHQFLDVFTTVNGDCVKVPNIIERATEGSIE